jgi:hypothetical protein
VNHANGILAAEGAVPDFVLPAEFVGHNDTLSWRLKKMIGQLKDLLWRLRFV